MEEALEFLRAAGISGAAKYAAGTVCCCVDEAQKIPPALEREAEAVLLKVSEAWTKLVSLPPGPPLSPPQKYFRTACSACFMLYKGVPFMSWQNYIGIVTLLLQR